ncbi:hypothetical protein SSX86_029505 [Deinandra increscens subsp. villosa]|uniref:Uncharacterized protein n=1 Tax=Deinandra increscens subsp. villosa TaxID=3103831 RepID=A0AAP0GMF1_9ASTR
MVGRERGAAGKRRRGGGKGLVGAGVTGDGKEEQGRRKGLGRSRVPYNIQSIEASKARKILPPPTPIQSPPAPMAPATSQLTVNRYKKYETRAFRPTCPGPSPGAGHQNPPGSC